MTLEELHAHQDQVDQKLLRLVSQVVSHVPGGRETFSTHLGTVSATKTDELSEKFQTTFDPPPHFRKSCKINFWIEIAPRPLWNLSENSSILVVLLGGDWFFGLFLETSEVGSPDYLAKSASVLGDFYVLYHVVCHTYT